MLLHGVNGILVLFCVAALGGPPIAAISAALLFALHPVNAFAATAPDALSDVLFTEDQLGRKEIANRLLLYAVWVAAPRGELDDAEDRARKAYALVPDSPLTAQGLARILAHRGKWPEVGEVLLPWQDPDSTKARRAQLLLETGSSLPARAACSSDRLSDSRSAGALNPG